MGQVVDDTGVIVGVSTGQIKNQMESFMLCHTDACQVAMNQRLRLLHCQHLQASCMGWAKCDSIGHSCRGYICLSMSNWNGVMWCRDNPPSELNTIQKVPTVHSQPVHPHPGQPCVLFEPSLARWCFKDIRSPSPGASRTSRLVSGFLLTLMGHIS